MTFNWLFFIAIAFALVDWYAAWKENRILLLIAKPAVVIFLILWTLQISGWQGAMLWFGLGLVFSLGGDVALLFSGRFFLLGLFFFLLAHISLIVGFNMPPAPLSMFSGAIAVIIGLTGSRVIKVLRPAIAKMPGSKKLLPASLVYGIALSLMVLSSFLTLFNNAWNPDAAFLCMLGGCFFFVSDLILAYDRFVTKQKHGRFIVHVSYHLGLIGIISGAVIQLVK